MSFDPWTIGLEVVNFLVLVWLLERLLYRPVLGVIARRQAEIESLQQADEAAHEALAAERERLAAEREAAAAERDRALDAAHAQAQQERARIEAQARAQMERLLAAGRARLDEERADAARALRRKSVEIGIEVARRLLAMSTPPEGDGRFVDAVCERLSRMSGDDRVRLFAGLGERAGVRVVTAGPLDAERQTHCRDRLERVLERDLDLVFSVDPSLIAGIEIHFPGVVMRHSWRDALDDIEPALVAGAQDTAAPGPG